MKDRVAIAAAASTGFTAANTPNSQTALAARACIDAVRQAGLTAEDIDGLCGSWPSAAELQSTLGLPRLTWSGNPQIPMVDHIATASAAVAAGLCDTALVYHAAYRAVWNTGSALKDPFRRAATPGLSDPPPRPETMSSSIGYAGWAARYLYEFGLDRDDLAVVALNARANAADNPYAAKRDPLTLEDYRAARIVRWPLGVYDMDVAVDGADAFIITTTERARDLALPPVLVHAAVLGQASPTDEDQTVSLRHHGQQVVIDTLRRKSDFWLDGVDVYFPYDGFTPITVNWVENAGWCAPGEGPKFLREHTVAGTNRVMINGRIPVNSHGGSLSEGATQGSGHVREAVHQLQGRAGVRQAPDARTALITAGGFFFNAQGLMLRAM